MVFIIIYPVIKLMYVLALSSPSPLSNKIKTNERVFYVVHSCSTYIV